MQTGKHLWAVDLAGGRLPYGGFGLPVVSADGRRVFVGESTVTVLDAATGRELARWDATATGLIPAEKAEFYFAQVAASPDGASDT